MGSILNYISSINDKITKLIQFFPELTVFNHSSAAALTNVIDLPTSDPGRKQIL